ncbi:MAG: ATP-binding cassette domain-containing protein [Candidatus Latescibacterota bacterium]|jgi:ATPase subunit of ABC transporter with duplicated ATPase domains
MNQREICFHQVAFSYESTAQPLFAKVDLHLATGWTGVVGANGTGKTTLLLLATGRLQPRAGRVDAPEAWYCPQRTDDPPEGLARLLADTSGSAASLCGRLGLALDWQARWPTLSHGERKRAQIAAALWQEPRALAVDEPTNHLDGPTRAMLFEALRRYHGIGLLVSHDRDLLDGLCDQCVFLCPPEAVLRPGGYSLGRAQEELEHESARRERMEIGRTVHRLEREAIRRRAVADRSQRRLSKRNLGKDNDARFKRNRARITGKDAVAGRQQHLLDGRLERERERLQGARVQKIRQLGIWIEGGHSPRDLLFRLPAGRIALGPARFLRHPDLEMRPADRVALTGPNGAGKSTLLQQIRGVLALPEERVAWVPQEIDAAGSRCILDSVRKLRHDDLGRLMTTVSCLGSDPDRLLATDLPSPGELRKLLLALGVARAPHLIVMDEPTNHLDLPSIECLEEALAECPCGLLLVSHDERFLRRLTQTRWVVVPAEGAGSNTELRAVDSW